MGYLFISSLDFVTDTVAIGKVGDVRISKEDYARVVAAGKPTAMALRLADVLFSVETLQTSTVHGTRDFQALDPKIIGAIKGKSE